MVLQSPSMSYLRTRIMDGTNRLVLIREVQRSGLWNNESVGYPSVLTRVHRKVFSTKEINLLVLRRRYLWWHLSSFLLLSGLDFKKNYSLIKSSGDQTYKYGNQCPLRRKRATVHLPFPNLGPGILGKHRRQHGGASERTKSDVSDFCDRHMRGLHSM